MFIIGKRYKWDYNHNGILKEIKTYQNGNQYGIFVADDDKEYYVLLLSNLVKPF